MYSILNSPIGILQIEAEEDAITGLYIANGLQPEAYDISDNPVMQQCRQELCEYFEGSRRRFDVKLKLKGTEFQKKVWKELLEIPFGHTVSYKDIAVNIDNPAAPRAVGGANNKNPISIIVPCHRVIGANGSLVGYGGGLNIKIWLLEHEKKYLEASDEK